MQRDLDIGERTSCGVRRDSSQRRRARASTRAAPAVVGETRVVYYPSERQGETRFSAHDAEWFGGEAVAASVASYQAERGAVPCNSARVAEPEDSGESARNRWIETWTINLCGSDYRVPVHGEKSFLKTSYEVGTAQRIPGPQRQAFEPEYGEPSTTVSAYAATRKEKRHQLNRCSGGELAVEAVNRAQETADRFGLNNGRPGRALRTDQRIAKGDGRVHIRPCGGHCVPENTADGGSHTPG